MLAKGISVKTISLCDLLEKHKAPNNIDYLSIDTEGSELDILKSYFKDPRSKNYDIEVITVEHNEVQDYRADIFFLLMRNGYERVFTQISKWDDFYIKKRNV